MQLENEYPRKFAILVPVYFMGTYLKMPFKPGLDCVVLLILLLHHLSCTFSASSNSADSTTNQSEAVLKRNQEWWSKYCSNNRTKLALETIKSLPWMSHFDIAVLLDEAMSALFSSCARRLRLHRDFQMSVFSNWTSQLNSSTFDQSLLLLHFLDRLGPQDAVSSKLQQLRKSWRPQGYPSYFILASPGVFANETQIQSELRTWASKVAVDLNVYIWTHFENCTVDSLYEIYAIKNTTFVRDLLAPTMSKQAWKEPSANNTAKLISRKLWRRSNFNKAVIVGTNVDHPDYEAATKFRHIPNSTDVEFESGFEVYTYWYLRDGLNFTEKAIAWDSYIQQGPNGTLKGLALPVNNGTVDVACVMGEFLLWRFSGPDGLTYLQPMFFNLLIACFRQPPASSVRNIYLETFSNTLWLGLFALWVLLCLALTAAVRVARILNPLLRFGDDDDLPRDSWLWAVSATCQQGWHVAPNSGPSRIIFLMGFFSSLITFTAYSAALVATLSIQVIPVKSFADLLQYEFNILSDNHIPTAKFVVESLEGNQIIPTIPDSGRNVEVADKIDDLSRRRTAIVSQTDSFYPVLTKRGVTEFEACSQLSLVPYDPRPVLSGFTVKRGSPFRSYFNSKIIQMRERGVMMVLRRRYLDTTTFQCSDEGSDRRDAITIKDVLTAYAALLIGFAVSTISFCLEKAWFGRRQKQYGIHL